MKIHRSDHSVYSRITGTGSYLPANKVSNHDLEKHVDTTDAWIRERTGIQYRHLAADGETVVDIAFAALQASLDIADKSSQELDLIIVATCSTETQFPNVATQLQQRLNISGCPAFDINAACSGFIYGLSSADAMIRSGQYRCVAVIGAERMSSLINWNDRSTCVLFGDGAGAVILEQSEQPGILSCHIHADGQHGDLLKHDPARNVIVMEGNKVFKVAVKTLSRMVNETLAIHKMQYTDIDWLIPHQANLRIIQAVAHKLNLTEDRVIITVDQHANTSSASIPLALDSAVRSHRIQPGETILLEAFGAGFTWASALLSL